MTLRHVPFVTLAFLLALQGCHPGPETSPAPLSWRGMMVDTSRHFPSLEELRELLPQLREAKLNVLHLHLADGPGWRFQSERYPRLTEVGAWRVDKTDRPWSWRATEFWTSEHEARGLKKYGGFYSAEELAALADDARQYGITLVPEIDVPGHAAALLTAYPELACPVNRDPRQWFLGKDVICVGNPKTLELLDTVIGELCDTLPGAPIHIGCDEVPAAVWDACPLCRDPAVRRRFYERLTDCVRKRGREVLAWDDLRAIGIDLSGVTLTCWHDDAIPRPNDIACPYSFCYLDQAASRARLPDWELPNAVRGVQINLWTEDMPTQAIRAKRIREGLHGFRQALDQHNARNPANNTP